MNLLSGLFAAGMAGALLGLLFFYGLWTTVRRLEHAGHPAMLMLGSMILRFGLILTGFLLLSRYGGWPHLLVAAGGFFLVRVVLLRRIRNGDIRRKSTT